MRLMLRLGYMYSTYISVNYLDYGVTAWKKKIPSVFWGKKQFKSQTDSVTTFALGFTYLILLCKLNNLFYVQCH